MCCTLRSLKFSGPALQEVVVSPPQRTDKKASGSEPTRR